MGDLFEIVDSLENKVRKLLNEVDQLQKQNETLRKELIVLREVGDSDKTALLEWQRKYRSLKTAQAMLGSNDNTTEAKLKINHLIRELDSCIAQLSE